MNAFQVPLSPAFLLVNESAKIVEREKGGVFLTRLVFDWPLAVLAYAMPDFDSDYWCTGVT